MTDELTPEQVKAYRQMQAENWNFCDYIPPSKEERPRSQAREAWERRIHALTGSPEHRRLVREMQRVYESQGIPFFHPMVQGEDYLEKWKESKKAKP